MKIYKIAAVAPGKVKLRIKIVKGQAEVEVLERGPNVKCDEKMEAYISDLVANSLGDLITGPIKIRLSADGLQEMQENLLNMERGGPQTQSAPENQDYIPPLGMTEGPAMELN